MPVSSIALMFITEKRGLRWWLNHRVGIYLEVVQDSKRPETVDVNIVEVSTRRTADLERAAAVKTIL